MLSNTVITIILAVCLLLSLGANVKLYIDKLRKEREMVLWRWICNAVGRRFWMASMDRKLIASNWRISAVPGRGSLALRNITEELFDKSREDEIFARMEERLKSKTDSEYAARGSAHNPIKVLSSKGEKLFFSAVPRGILESCGVLCFSDESEALENGSPGEADDSFREDLEYCYSLLRGLQGTHIICGSSGSVMYGSESLCRSFGLADKKTVADMSLRNFAEMTDSVGAMKQVLQQVEHPESCLHCGGKYSERIRIKIGSEMHSFIVTVCSSVLHERRAFSLVSFMDVSSTEEMAEGVAEYAEVKKAVGLSVCVKNGHAVSDEFDRFCKISESGAEIDERRAAEWLVSLPAIKRTKCTILEQTIKQCAQTVKDVRRLMTDSSSSETAVCKTVHLRDAESGQSVRVRLFFCKIKSSGEIGYDRLLTAAVREQYAESVSTSAGETSDKLLKFLKELPDVTFYIGDITNDFELEDASEAFKGFCAGNRYGHFGYNHSDPLLDAKQISFNSEYILHNKIIKNDLGNVKIFYEAFINKSGETVYLKSYKIAYRAGSGEYRTFNLSFNITEFENKAMDNLDKLEMFKRMLDLMPVGAVIRRVSGNRRRYVYGNNAIDDLLSLNYKRDFDGHFDDDSELSGIDTAAVSSEAVAMQSGDEDQSAASVRTLSVRRGDGSTGSVTCTSRMHKIGSAMYIMSVYNDTTQERSNKAVIKSMEDDIELHRRLGVMDEFILDKIGQNQFSEFLYSFAEYVGHFMNADICMVASFDNSASAIVCDVEWTADDLLEADMSGCRIFVSINSLTAAFERRGIVAIEDFASSDFQPVYEPLFRLGVKSAYGVPIYTQDSEGRNVLRRCIVIGYIRHKCSLSSGERSLIKELVLRYNFIFKYYRILEQASVESEQYGNVLSLVPMPIMIIDKKHVIQRVNRRFCEVMHGTPDLFEGKNCAALFCSNVNLRTACPAYKCMHGGGMGEVVRYFPNTGSGKRFRMVAVKLTSKQPSIDPCGQAEDSGSRELIAVIYNEVTE